MLNLAIYQHIKQLNHQILAETQLPNFNLESPYVCRTNIFYICHVRLVVTGLRSVIKILSKANYIASGKGKQTYISTQLIY